MKKLFAMLLAAMMLLSACTPNAQQTKETVAVGDSGVIDFVTSQFKHITNGGITEDENLPYNIDAITGATITSRAVTDGINAALRCVEAMGQGG
jgi:Na+-translocating ferredoxin:NAD+ oxidoreductase RnfG subunit